MKCKADECDRTAVAHEWCLMHYKRWWRAQGGPFYRPTPLCTIESCNEPHVGKGYCSEHYDRWRRRGDPLAPAQFKPHEALNYYHDHVADRQVECKVWPYRLNPAGYPVVNVEPLAGPQLVTRMACEERWGPPPNPKSEAAHAPVICHNRACWNGDHLRWATRREQYDDMVLDGTAPIGERQWSTRLTDVKVIDMRARHAAGDVSLRDLAAEFSISHSQVRRIIRRENWSHI